MVEVLQPMRLVSSGVDHHLYALALWKAVDATVGTALAGVILALVKQLVVNMHSVRGSFTVGNRVL